MNSVLSTTLKARRTLALAALVAFSSLAAAMPSSANESYNRHPPEECASSPEGSWLYTVTIPSPAGNLVFNGVETYSAGGGYSEADELSFMPDYLATAGHGAWEMNGARGFLLTYVNLTHDANGGPTGSSRVRQATRISADGNTYTGSGDFAYYDANGQPYPGGSDTFTITAKRIVVQAPK